MPCTFCFFSSGWIRNTVTAATSTTTMTMTRLPLFLLLILLLRGGGGVGGVGVVNAASPVLDCDPCIQRSEYKIKAIYHGEKTDPFWLQVEAAAKQTAYDLNIRLDVTLYDEFNPNQMAQDLEVIASLPMDSIDRPDALIVSIPSPIVASAIQGVINSGIPVFGCNSGYKVASNLGIISFVAQDEYLAGVEAANEIIRHITESGTTIETVLFINHEKGNTAIQDRFDGFTTTMEASIPGIFVEELIVDGKLDDQVLVEDIRPVFTGCPYDIVQLANARLIDLAIAAFDGLFADCTGRSLLGTFDSNRAVYGGIIQRKVVVGVSQQQYLQGVIPILLATLYVTTGQSLNPPAVTDSEYEIFLSGPSILNLDNVPSDTRQICADDAYPICPNDKSLTVDGSDEISLCPCTTRSNIRIGGVLHGVTSDTYWDPIFAAARQSAIDMDIELELERFEDDEPDILLGKMASKITSLCNGNVDGVFVSIPNVNDEGFIKALTNCQALRVPIISINAGGEISQNETYTGLIQHHIGQLEYNAGYTAGQELLKAGVINGWCINHEPGVSAVTSRCTAMQDAFEEEGSSGATFMGIINVPKTDDATYMTLVEDAVGTTGGTSWSGVGLLVLGQIQIPAALSLKQAHIDVQIGTFDVSDEIYTNLDSNQLLFAIDQRPILQGALPIPLLTVFDYSKEKLETIVLETGPNFIFTSPSPDHITCEENLYEVCERTEIPGDNDNMNGNTGNESGGSNLGGRGTFLLRLLWGTLLSLPLVAFVGW